MTKKIFTLLKVFMTLCLLLVGFGNVWGGEITFTPNSETNTTGVIVSPISFAFTNGGTATKWYDDGLRFYENATITVSSESTITKIEFTHGVGNNGCLILDGSTGTYSSKTWTGSAKSVKFKVTHSSGTKNGQVKLTQVKVTYEGATKTLESIAISGTPTKTTYEVGESFDPVGLVVTGTYDDKSTAEITSGITWTCTPSPLTAGTTSVDVTATVDGKSDTKSYNVTVTEPVITPGTYEIALNNALYGVATGNNGTEQSVTKNGITIVSGCSSSASSKTYYDKDHIRYYIDSYLKLSVPVGYEITSVVFTPNGTWNGGISVYTGKYDDKNKTWTGKSQEVDFSFSQQCRAAKITVTYIRNKTLESIAVTKLPTKSVYKVSEEFDASGLEVMGTYTDESSAPLSSTQYALSSPDMSSAGQKTITVSATGVENASFNIDVVALDKIEITTSPEKTAYNEGESFEPAGMVVKGTWGIEDGKIIVEENLTGYTITNGSYLEASQTSVTISYTHEGTTKTTTQAITVTGITKYGVTFIGETEEGTLTVKVGDETITTGTEIVEGTIVSLTSSPKTGYKQASTPFEVKDADKNDVKVSKSGDVYTFTMPAKAVTITAKFSKVYKITIPEDIPHVEDIEIKDKDGNPITETSLGSKVVVVVTPEQHYSLSTLYYIKEGEESHNDITVDDKGVYSFTMPASAVTINATLAEDEKYTVTFSVNGENTTSDANYAGEPVEFPTVSPIAGYTFMGWTEQAIDGKQDDAPEFVENVVYPANNYAVYYAVFAKKEGSENYVKVTTAPTDWCGKYLIVYEAGNVAFDGSLATLDAVSNSKAVTINNNVIASSEEMDAIAFTVAYKTESNTVYSLKSASGKYISGTTTTAKASNGIKQADTDADYEISFNGTTIESKSSDGQMQLKYNKSDGQTRFRFYSSGQEDIALYKKQEATYSDYCTTIIYVTSIKVATAPTTTAYKAGDKFNPAGLVITLTYSDETTEDVAYVGNEDKFTFEPSLDTPLTTDITSATITYAGKETTQTIEVRALETYNITWKANGEEFTTTQVTEGDALVLPGTNPEAIGDFVFQGWTATEKYYDAETAPEYITNETVPTENTTYYAVYAKKEGEDKYVKVTSAPTDWCGKYLIVYEAGNVAFDGSLATLDAVSNSKAVTINNNVIASSEEMDAIAFTVAYKTESNTVYSLKSASGKYISGTKTANKAANGIEQADTDEGYEISFNGTTIEIESKSSDMQMVLKYNKASDQKRFRFYKSGQEDIALYKKQEATYSNYTTTITTTATMSITSAKWSTFIAPFDVEIPEGVEAYTVTANEDALVYKPVKTTIPACTPVVLFKDVTETYKQDFVGVDNAIDRTFKEGNLVGTLDKIAKGYVPKKVGGAPVYLLQNNNDNVGFYMLDPDPDKTYSLNANRAYLVGVATASAKAYYGFDDNDPTGINNLRGEWWNVPREGIFDLSGRKLSAPQKGVNIINGVKVIIK